MNRLIIESEVDAKIIKHPLWSDVLKAITELSIDCTIYLVAENKKEMQIQGGPEYFVINCYWDKNAIEYENYFVVDWKKSTERIDIFSDYSCDGRLCIALNLTLQAAKYYFEYNEMDKDQNWEDKNNIPS